MTSPAAARYARSSNWQDFERLSMALLSDIHQTRFRRWGSASQRKDGVDAWAKLPDGRVVVLRCEGRTENFGKPLAQADIDAALAELRGFPQPVDECIVLTTGPDDPALAAYAGERAAGLEPNRPSSVALWGWPTIAAHVDRHPKVAGAFFGHELGASSKKKLVLFAAALLIVAGGAGSLFLGKNAIDASQATPRNPAANVGGIAANLDELAGTYRQCQALLGENTFTFTHALIDTCRDPAASQLAALAKKVDKQRAGFDAQVQAELARMLVIFHEDVREAAAVTSAAHVFDNAVIGAMKDACGPGPAKERDAATVKLASVAAVTAQRRYYYLLKDFIIPEMAAAKDILRLHADGAPAPERMKAAAGRMEQLLTERTAYAVKETRWPFTLSSLKHTAARDAVPDQQDDAAEEARWREVLAQAATQSLRGRDKVKDRDIEALVACGALKEHARTPAQPGS